MSLSISPQRCNRRFIRLLPWLPSWKHTSYIKQVTSPHKRLEQSMFEWLIIIVLRKRHGQLHVHGRCLNSLNFYHFRFIISWTLSVPFGRKQNGRSKGYITFQYDATQTSPMMLFRASWTTLGVMLFVSPANKRSAYPAVATNIRYDSMDHRQTKCYFKMKQMLAVHHNGIEREPGVPGIIDRKPANRSVGIDWVFVISFAYPILCNWQRLYVSVPCLAQAPR